MSLNRVILVGNVGQAPEIRATSDGRRIATLSLATSERWVDKRSGERKEAAEWHRVVVFNEHIAGIVEQYVRKGSKICVEGQLKTRKWTDNSGVDHYTTVIQIGAFNGSLSLESPRPGESGDGGAGGGPSGGGGGPSYARATRDELDDEIPF